MKPKKNPLLAKFEAQLEHLYQCRLSANTEIDLIAFMFTIHEDLQVGPGRAGKLCNDFIANRIDIAETAVSDYGDKKDEGDKEMLHTKHTLAKRLRRIFSPEDWQKAKVLFPMLEEYWDIEV